MSAWEMVTECIDDQSGRVFSSGRTVTHGWASPTDAVENWAARGHFKRPGVQTFRNGKSESTAHGYTVRTYFVAGVTL